MGMTFNTDTGIEEYFVGSKKILTHNIRTNEVTYHALPVNHIEVYGAFETVDEYGRRGRCVGYFSTLDRAIDAAEGKGFYGSKGEVETFAAIEILNRGHRSVYILKQASPIDLDQEQAAADEELRQKTLAAMTDEQRRVLGLPIKVAA